MLNTQSRRLWSPSRSIVLTFWFTFCLCQLYDTFVLFMNFFKVFCSWQTKRELVDINSQVCIFSRKLTHFRVCALTSFTQATALLAVGLQRSVHVSSLNKHFVYHSQNLVFFKQKSCLCKHQAHYVARMSVFWIFWLPQNLFDLV